MPPESTTQPVTTMNTSVNILMRLTTFMPRTPHLGKRVCRTVTKLMTAMAIPRFSHSVAVRPATMRVYCAKMIHPLAV
jgi:hypothetical protein